MSARIICSPSWNYTECVNATSPEQLGKALVELVRRDGPDEVSDTLSAFDCWDRIAPDVDGVGELGAENCHGDKFVEGYGVAYSNLDGVGYFDYDYVYGLLTDGAIIVTHCDTGLNAAVVPKALDDALAQLSTLQEEIAQFQA